MSKVAFRNRAPADADVLGGSHERLASAIASLIRESDHGMSVAIMGGWGSGKSTVVNLIAHQLIDAKTDPVETRVFIFDAWAHQGDPLRRSFLECFFQFMAAADSWVQKDAPWDGNTKHTVEEHIKRTTGQSETVITKTNKRLSPWGIAVTVTTLLAAGAAAILPKLDTTKPNTWIFFWFQLVALLLPFGIALLARISGEQDRTLYQLLVRDAGEEKTVETSKTLDPTAVDFQTVFATLCSRALNQHRRLLIVIDNLDRIEASEALNMWATMRTFFEYDAAGRHTPGANDWRKRLWLLIPLDRSALQRLWKDDGSGSLISAFVQKTFDIVYDVPAPILSRRKDFFQSEIKAAIDDSTQDYEVVYLLADRYREQISTPREIKLFINRLAGLYLQWKGTIDLPLLALYILQTASPMPADSTPAESAAPPATVSPAPLPRTPAPREFDFNVSPAILDLLTKPEWRERWEASMGAIHYNVALEDAGEVVDGPRILDALERNPTRLLDLVQRKWFWAVCHRVVQDRDTEWVAGPDLLAAAIIALNGCPSPATPEDARTASNVWKALKSMALRSHDWKLSERLADAMLILNAHPEVQAEQPMLKRKLLEAVKRVPPAMTDPALMAELRGETTERQPLSDWARATIRLINHLDPAAPIDLTAQWGTAMLLIAASWQGPELPIAHFTTRDPKAALVALATIGFQNNIGPSYWALLQRMKTTGAWPWTEVRNIRLPWTSGTVDWDVAARVIRFLLFADPDAAKAGYAPYTPLVQAGSPPGTSLAVLVDQAFAAQNWSDAARLLLVLYGQSTIVSIHPSYPSPNPKELVDAVMDILSSIGRLDVALGWMEVSDGANLCHDVVIAAVAAGRASQLAPVANNLIAFQVLCKLLPADVAGNLVSQLVNEEAFVTKALTQVTAEKLLLSSEIQNSVEAILAGSNFPSRPQFLQKVLKEAAQVDLTDIPGPFLKRLIELEGVGWLPLHRTVSALAHLQAASTPLTDYLKACFQRRIDIGPSTVDDLVSRAKQAEGPVAAAIYDLAIERAQSDAALTPDSAPLQIVWGRTLLQKAGEQYGKIRNDLYTSAQEHFVRATQLDTQSAEAQRSLVDTLLLRAENLERTAARTQLQTALTSIAGSDRLSGGRLHLALASLNQGPASLPECDLAIDDFRAVLTQDPSDTEALRFLAEALTEKARRSPSAEADPLYDEAETYLGLIPTPDPQALVSEGRVLLARARAGAA